VQTDTIRLGGQLGGEIYFFEETDITLVGAADESNTAASVHAIKDYIQNRPVPNLEELNDTKELANATEGQVPSWDAANSKWVPYSVSAALSGLTDVTLTTPADGQVLTYKTDHWESQTPDTYTKAEVDAKVAVPAKVVAISAADYNALVTKDPNTLYVLT
jgi:hypothetical protein